MIIDEINKGRKLVSDGAWGTFLQNKGLQGGECPEEWNLSRPADVMDIAKSYIEAGADMIETNSFGGNYFKLKNYGLEDRVYEINYAAAHISRQAAGDNHFVMGSVGPTGKLLIMEEVTEADLYDAFKEQSMALEAGGADAIIIETMTDLEEARIAVKAAKENTRIPVFCTMTFDKILSGEFRTMMGISPTEMTNVLVAEGVSVIGANCGNGIADMIGIVKEIRSANATVPILIHANAGLPHFYDGQTVFPETPEDMASRVRDIVLAGANIIGGCCGTTPGHICRVSEEVKKLNDQAE
ncbi:MAG TPA: homocysteine S-methyltransferase family protein [Prolixibacteraceae bacterium]|nr:homocysteine S-methyltransferase family protein [Prolixibacteraceae bacterium]